VATVEIPLGGVAPGEYSLRATVKARGETVINLDREVTILPGMPPPAPPTAAKAFEPADVLNGPVAQRLVASLRDSATDSATKNAAALAAARAWDQVAAATAGPPPATMALLALRGMGRFAQRQYAGAAVDLQAALDLDPTSSVTAFLLGWAHSAAGNESAAITAWRAATVAAPTLIPAYLALADAYLRQSQPALARQVIQAGLTALPASVELLSKLAEIERR
jgi:tetratricopeptide (TPR) repeat protein